MLETPEQQERTNPSALPSSPKTAAIAPIPSRGIRQGYRTENGVGVHLRPLLPSATAGTLSPTSGP